MHMAKLVDTITVSVISLSVLSIWFLLLVSTGGFHDINIIKSD